MSRPFTEVFLETESRTRLLAWCQVIMGPPRGTVYAEHMTIKFQPSDKEIAATPIGSSVSLSVIGYASDARCQAVVVTCEKAPSVNRIPHITVSVHGVPPVYSKDLLAHGWKAVSNGPLLFGQVRGPQRVSARAYCVSRISSDLAGLTLDVVSQQQAVTHLSVSQKETSTLVLETSNKDSFTDTPYQIFYKISNAGNGSKRRIVWRWAWSSDKKKHIVELTLSVVDGKKVILLDGRVVISISNMPSMEFSHGWEEDGHIFRVEINRSSGRMNISYVFSIDGIKFEQMSNQPMKGAGGSSSRGPDILKELSKGGDDEKSSDIFSDNSEPEPVQDAEAIANVDVDTPSAIPAHSVSSISSDLAGLTLDVVSQQQAVTPLPVSQKETSTPVQEKFKKPSEVLSADNLKRGL